MRRPELSRFSRRKSITELPSCAARSTISGAIRHASKAAFKDAVNSVRDELLSPQSITFRCRVPSLNTIVSTTAAVSVVAGEC